LYLHLIITAEQTAPTSTNLSNGVTSTAGSSDAANIKSNKGTERSLSAKLSYVACEVSNLPDAIFALNEWTTKSASRGKVEKYLLEMTTESDAYGEETEGNKQGPLRAIIQRVLLHSNNPKQDQTIVVGCANWIISILLGPACNLHAANKINNSKMAHSTTMKKAVGELLRRGRACAAQLASKPLPKNSPALYHLRFWNFCNAQPLRSNVTRSKALM
jgi:hypothetical protein